MLRKPIFAPRCFCRRQFRVVLALASNNRVKRTRLFCQISGTSAWITSHPTSLAGAGHESRAWLPTRSHLAQHTEMLRYGRLRKP